MQLTLLDWSPDGRRLLFCTTAGECHIMDAGGNPIARVPLHCQVQPLPCFSTATICTGAERAVLRFVSKLIGVVGRQFSQMNSTRYLVAKCGEAHTRTSTSKKVSSLLSCSVYTPAENPIHALSTLGDRQNPNARQHAYNIKMKCRLEAGLLPHCWPQSLHSSAVFFHLLSAGLICNVPVQQLIAAR